MSINSNQSQQPDPSDKYGGYHGYTPSNASEDPYGSYRESTGTTQSGTGSPSSNPNYVYGQKGGGQQQQTAGPQQQQQQYYQPPESVLGKGRGKSSNAFEPTSLGLSARMEALLSYLFLAFSGIVFFVLERKNRFVRFHAAQSIVLFGPALIAYALLQFLIKITAGIFLIGSATATVFGCLSTLILIPSVILWIFLMVQAYRGVSVKLPFVGKYAEGLLRRFSKKGTVWTAP